MSVDDPGAVEIVRRKLAANSVPWKDSDPVTAHLAGNVAEHGVVVIELDPKHGVR